MLLVSAIVALGAIVTASPAAAEPSKSVQHRIVFELTSDDPNTWDGAALVHDVIGSTGAYFEGHTPRLDWEWMVVLGVFIGSFMSSKLSGDRRHPVVPPAWRARFGDSVVLRTAAAFMGGAIMMVGARLARGCTSGHGSPGHRC